MPSPLFWINFATSPFRACGFHQLESDIAQPVPRYPDFFGLIHGGIVGLGFSQNWFPDFPRRFEILHRLHFLASGPGQKALPQGE